MVEDSKLRHSIFWNNNNYGFFSGKIDSKNEYDLRNLVISKEPGYFYKIFTSCSTLE